MIKAHRKGVEFLDKIVKVGVKEKSDVAITGCFFPVDINFYQSLNAITAVHRVPEPIVKKGATIILSAQCPEGIGSSYFEGLITKYSGPHRLMELISQPDFFEQDQWAAQIWADILMNYEVIIITEGISQQKIHSIGALYLPSLQEAVDYCIRKMGKDIKVTVLPEAPYTIPVLKS